MKKWSWTAAIAVIALAIGVVAAACGGDKEKKAEQPAAAQEEKGEVVLTVAVPAMPLGLDKDLSFGNFQTFESIGNCYEAGLNFKKIPYPYDDPPESKDLFYPDHGGPRDPWQLESVEIAPDGQSAILHIRPGVFSAVGNELTAEDIKWSIERANAVQGVGLFYTTLLGLDHENPVEVIDKYTAKVVASAPNGLLGLIWDDLYFAFIDSVEAKKHATAEDPWATEYAVTHCLGYGAYTVETWTAGQEIVWVKNPNYWGPEPQIDRIIYRVIPDASVRLTALQQGEIDIAENLTPDQQVAAGKSPGVRAIGVRSDYLLFLYTNQDLFEPFKDKRVRQALNYVMPRREIVESIYQGQAIEWKAATATIFPGTDLEAWPYGDAPDFETAKALLAEAGYADGFDVELSYTTAVPIWEQVANLIKANLAQININVTLNPLPDADFAVASFERTTLPFGLWLDAPGGSDPVYNAFIYYYDENVIGAFSRIGNPEVTRILDEAKAKLTLDERVAATQPAHPIVLDDAFFTFLVEPYYTIALRDNIKGFVWYAWENFYFRELTKE